LGKVFTKFRKKQRIMVSNGVHPKTKGKAMIGWGACKKPNEHKKKKAAHGVRTSAPGEERG